MITFQQKKNEEDFSTELKEQELYMSFIDEVFKIIKIRQVEKKTIIYTECFLYLDCGEIILRDSQIEKKFILKEKSYFKKFELNDINPFIEDLSEISNISYPSILFNLKFRRELGKHFVKAGKISIGIDLYKNIELDPSNFLEYDIKNLHNQTVIINGLPNSGKTKLAKKLAEKIFVDFSGFQSKENFSILNSALEFLEFFGNAVDYRELIEHEGQNFGLDFNVNSSRYMRVLKFYFNSNNKKLLKIKNVKIRHFLFEKSRIISENGNFNFHAIHAVIEGLFQIFENNLEKENFSETFQLLKSEFLILVEKGILKELYETYNKFDDYKIENENEIFDFNKFYLEKFWEFIYLLKKFSLENKKVFIKINKIIIAILLLNKLEFDITEDGKAFLDEEEKLILIISNFLDCDKKILKDRLISREIKSPRGSFYVVKFTYEEASRTKDNFVKFLYENLFEFITRYINVELSNKFSAEEEFSDIKSFTNFSNSEISINASNLANNSNSKFIKIIECFGFENSDDPTENSLENLFINYSNDKLNLLLFDLFIKAETEIYKNEGILDFNQSPNSSDILKTSRNRSLSLRTSKLSHHKVNEIGVIDFDIQSTMTALEDNNKGIFKLIDVQSSLINTSKGALSNLCESIQSNWPQLNASKNSFNLVHFGKEVEYGSDDFIQKNVDSVNEDLKNIVNKFFKKLSKYLNQVGEKNFSKTSKNFSYLMKSFGNRKVNNFNFAQTTSNLIGRKSLTIKFHQNIKLKSNSEKFLREIKNLIDKITKNEVKFIKLITHCESEKKMMTQIYSSGILESLLIAKGGYFMRHNLKDMIQRLKIFRFYFNLDLVDGDEKISEFVKKLSQLLKIQEKDIVFGKTLLLIKNDSLKKNKELIYCKDLLSFCIRKLLKTEFNKIFNLVWFISFLKKSLLKKKIINFFNDIEIILEKSKRRLLIRKLSEILEIHKFYVRRIQQTWRKFYEGRCLKKERENSIKELNIMSEQNKICKHFRTKNNVADSSPIDSYHTEKTTDQIVTKNYRLNRSDKEHEYISNLIDSNKYHNEDENCENFQNYENGKFKEEKILEVESVTINDQEEPKFISTSSMKDQIRKVSSKNNDNPIITRQEEYLQVFEKFNSNEIFIEINNINNYTEYKNKKSEHQQSSLFDDNINQKENSIIEESPEVICGTRSCLNQENERQNIKDLGNMVNLKLELHPEQNIFYEKPENYENNKNFQYQKITKSNSNEKSVSLEESNSIQLEKTFCEENIVNKKEHNSVNIINKNLDYKENLASSVIQFQNGKIEFLDKIEVMDYNVSNKLLQEEIKTKNFKNENEERSNNLANFDITKYNFEMIIAKLNRISVIYTERIHKNEFFKILINEKIFFDSNLIVIQKFVKRFLFRKNMIAKNKESKRKKFLESQVHNNLIPIIYKIYVHALLNKILTNLSLIGLQRMQAIRKIQNYYNNKKLLKISQKNLIFKIQKSLRVFLFNKRISRIFLSHNKFLNHIFFSNMSKFIGKKTDAVNKIIKFYIRKKFSENYFKIFSMLRKFTIKIFARDFINIFYCYSSINKNYDIKRAEEFFTIRFSEMKLNDNHFDENTKSRSEYENKVEQEKFYMNKMTTSTVEKTSSKDKKKIEFHEEKKKNLENLIKATEKIEEEIITFNTILDKCSHELDDLLQQISENVNKIKTNTSFFNTFKKS